MCKGITTYSSIFYIIILFKIFMKRCLKELDHFRAYQDSHRSLPKPKVKLPRSWIYLHHLYLKSTSNRDITYMPQQWLRHNTCRLVCVKIAWVKIICLGWDPCQHWHYDLQWPKNIRESCLFFWRSASYRVPFPFPTFPSNYLDTRTHQTSFRPSKTSTPKKF